MDTTVLPLSVAPVPLPGFLLPESVLNRAEIHGCRIAALWAKPECLLLQLPLTNRTAFYHFLSMNEPKVRQIYLSS